MRFLDVLPLTEDVLTAALGYESLSFEDAQVAAAGDLAGVHAILTSDAGFVRAHANACSPGELVSVLERNLGGESTCRVVRVSEDGAFRALKSFARSPGSCSLRPSRTTLRDCPCEQSSDPCRRSRLSPFQRTPTERKPTAGSGHFSCQPPHSVRCCRAFTRVVDLVAIAHDGDRLPSPLNTVVMPTWRCRSSMRLTAPPVR